MMPEAPKIISATRPTMRLTKAAPGLGLILMLLAAAACTAENPSKVEASKSVEAASGILQTTMGAYSFLPTTCAVYVEDGVNDIEIQGSGTAPDGEVFFFELSSTANAMTVGLGVDGPFVMPEREFTAGRVTSQEFSLVVTGAVISADNLALVDEQGRPVDSDASLRITCP